MTSGRYGPALRQIGRLLNGGAVASLDAGRLLERFAATHDEAAFEALIHQHGPMVLGTCRRMLADPHDVEDAFQATFLVLARRAGSIRDADRLGPWLHGVARRVASRSRALSARRNDLRRVIEIEPSAEPADALETFELREAVDEELASLPEKYRAPLILCYLEGLTHDEAAAKLRWPVGTVRSRLAGGRDRLRARLTRRGLAPASASALALPMVIPRASIPQALLSTTIRVATSSGTIPAHVATLAQGAVVAMIWNKCKLVALLALTAGLTVGGAGIAGQQQGEGGQGQTAVATAKPIAGSSADDDLAKLQGRWRMRQVDPTPGELGAGTGDPGWTIEGKILIMTEWGHDVLQNELVLGRQGDRKTLDIIHLMEDGTRTPSRCLYLLDGDTLKICAGEPDGPRPTDFSVAVGPAQYPQMIRLERRLNDPPALNAQTKQPERRPVAKQGQAGEPSFFERYFELQKRQEELKYQLKLLEIKNKQLSGDSNDPPAPEKAKAAFDSLNETIKKLEGDLASQTTQMKAFEEEAKKRSKPASLDDDLAKLQGRWRIVKVVPVPGVIDKDANITEWAIDGKTMTFTELSAETLKELRVERNELRLGIQGATRTIDLIHDEDGDKSTSRGLYDLAGDTLLVCIAAPDAPRPEQIRFGPGRFPIIIRLERQAVGQAAINGLNESIKKLESDLASKTAQIQALQDEIKKPAPSPRPIKLPPADGVPDEKEDQEQVEDESLPLVVPMNYDPAGNPDLVAVIPSTRDRIRIVEAKTRERFTFRIPGELASVFSMRSRDVVALYLLGKNITRTAVFDRKHGGWIEHELPQPATEINPRMLVSLIPAYDTSLVGFAIKAPEIRELVVYDGKNGVWSTQKLREPIQEPSSPEPILGNGVVIYRVGRSVYAYSSASKKWAVLDLKTNDPNVRDSQFWPGDTGRVVVKDGTITHSYDPSTGEWTSVDGKVEK